MKRDPMDVSRVRVGAMVLAGFVDGFMETLSTKTMFYMSVLVFGSLAVLVLVWDWNRGKKKRVKYHSDEEEEERPRRRPRRRLIK
jgi:hypothetical protein